MYFSDEAKVLKASERALIKENTQLTKEHEQSELTKQETQDKLMILINERERNTTTIKELELQLSSMKLEFARIQSLLERANSQHTVQEQAVNYRCLFNVFVLCYCVLMIVCFYIWCLSSTELFCFSAYACCVEPLFSCSFCLFFCFYVSQC